MSTIRVFNRAIHSFPLGFSVGGIHCGIKKTGALDLALVCSDKPCVSSGVFTKNKFRAAPVLYSQQVLAESEFIDSIVINSGCANAVTGNKGLENAKEMAEIVKRLKNGRCLVMSTGVIGHHLNMTSINSGINSLVNVLGNDEKSWTNCAKAFMTTDTRHKLISRTFNLNNNKTYTITGISKGAGMIHPNMATLLSLVCCDVSIDKQTLDECMKYATERSFNSISIDGDTSTNDTCIVMCNGKSNHKINSDQSHLEFKKNLTDMMTDLAKLIISDAEGATKFIQVNIKNAKSYEIAKEIANSVCSSTLVKTALFGEDANWGRIICAVGYSKSSAHVDPSKISLSIKGLSSENSLSENNIELLENGQPIPMDEDNALKVMKHKNIEINIDLKNGNENATMWTCDLSHEYVTINGSYRS